MNAIEMIVCANCKTYFGMALELYVAAKARSDINFFCPYGHSNYFPKGETDADKLRRERDRLQQQLAHKDDVIKAERERAAALDRRLIAAKGQITKTRKRVSNGICPCCSRTFGNLARHMATKHADYQKEEAHG